MANRAFSFFAFIVSITYACSGYASPEKNEDRMLNLLNGYSDVNEVRLVYTYINKHNNKEIEVSATPILAAITLNPNALVDLIKGGADVNHVKGAKQTPLKCASNPQACREFYFRLPKGDSDSADSSYEMMSILLENGANPDEQKYSFDRTVKETIICDVDIFNKSRYLTDSKIKKLKLLYDYGAKFDEKAARRCWNAINNDLKVYKRAIDSTSNDPYTVTVAEIEAVNAQAMLTFLENYIEKILGKDGFIKLLPKYFEIHEELLTNFQREEQRGRRMAAKQIQLKRREKMAAIKDYIDGDAGLRSALSNIAQLAAEKNAAEWMVLQNRFGADECETRVDGEYFKSQACESSSQNLISQIKSHYSSLNSTYQKQRDWFIGLFGKNASLVEVIVDDRVDDVGSSDGIKQQYAPAFQQLRRITETEARAERSARKRQEQRMMAGFMRNIQSEFEKKNRMLDRNMARTQQTINQVYSAQRSSGANAGSGQRARSYTTGIQDLNRKLDEIDHSFEVSVSEVSETKSKCVARSESTGPNPNVPEQYCQYVFADYTDNVSFSLGDYSNEFMRESHNKESAKETLGFELLKKAKKQCRAKGYSRVHHDKTYKYNQVEVSVGQCKENNRMGSISYLCGGTASFICARSD